MRIVLIPSSYVPVTGGLQTVTSALARSLKARGHEVGVITNRYPTKLATEDIVDEVPITRWHFLFPRFEQLKSLRFDLFLAGIFIFPLTLLRLWLRLRRERPDVVNVHFVHATGLFVLLCRRLMKFRLVVSLHGDDVEGLPGRPQFDRWLFRSLLRAADVVTACSRYLLDRAVETEQDAAEKGCVIHNGVEVQPENNDQIEQLSVVAAGRLVPKKGFDVLLRAFASGHHKTSRLALIGDGPERDHLKQLARSLGLNGEVSFHGAGDHTETLNAMRRASVVAIPSLQEPFGMVALEGMALGKPIVASRVGGLPEVLEGAEVVLVQPGDAAALATAITDALDRSKRDPNFGQRNRELAAKFSTARMVEQYLETYS